MKAVDGLKVLGWKAAGGLLCVGLLLFVGRIANFRSWYAATGGAGFIAYYVLTMSIIALGLWLMFDNRYDPFPKGIRVIGGLLFLNMELASLSYVDIEFTVNGPIGEAEKLASLWNSFAMVATIITAFYLMFGGRSLWKVPKEHRVDRLHLVRLCGATNIAAGAIFIWWFEVLTAAKSPTGREWIPFAMYFCSAVHAAAGLYLLAGAPGLIGRPRKETDEIVLWREAGDFIAGLLSKNEAPGP